MCVVRRERNHKPSLGAAICHTFPQICHPQNSAFTWWWNENITLAGLRLVLFLAFFFRWQRPSIYILVFFSIDDGDYSRDGLEVMDTQLTLKSLFPSSVSIISDSRVLSRALSTPVIKLTGQGSSDRKHESVLNAFSLSLSALSSTTSIITRQSFIASLSPPAPAHLSCQSVSSPVLA